MLNKDFNEKLTYFKLKKVFEELKKIGDISQTMGLNYKITFNPILSFHFGWETESKGLWITFFRDTIPNGILYALPITTLKTNTYAPYYIGGTNPAADLIHVNKNIMIFCSYENIPPDSFIKKIFTRRESISDLIPMCSVWQRDVLIEVEMNDPICVDTPASPSKEEIIKDVVEKMPEILAIEIGVSGYSDREIIAKDDFQRIYNFD